MSIVTEKSVSPNSSEYPLSWRLSIISIVILAISYSNNAMDRTLFSMLLPWITKTYGYSLKDAGLLSTVFTLGIGIASYPIGRLIDQTSRKTVMIAGMIIYSVFTFATILATGFWDMFFYRLLTGVGEAMQISALFAAVGSYFYKHKAKAIGSINMGYALGAISGPLLGTKLTLSTNNWHTSFFVFAVLGLVLAVIVWLAVPKDFTDCKGPANTTETVKLSHVPENFWNRNIILISLATLIYGMTGYAILGLYPTYMIKVLKFAPMVASGAMGFFGAGAILGLVGGWVGDRFGTKRGILFGWVGYAIVAYLLYNVATQPWQTYTLLFLIGAFGSALLHPNNMSLIQRSVQPEMVGRATGMYTTSLFMAAAFSGYLFGGFVEAVGWAIAGTILLTGASIIPFILILLVRDDQRW